MITVKPSQIEIDIESGLPFSNTFGKSELEFTAWLLTLCCQRLGDKWQPIRFQDAQHVSHTCLQSTHESRTIQRMLTNPFFNLDLANFVKNGWGIWSGEGDDKAIEMSEAAIAKLASMWRKDCLYGIYDLAANTFLNDSSGKPRWLQTWHYADSYRRQWHPKGTEVRPLPDDFKIERST
jgi:hypothetical protein